MVIHVNYNGHTCTPSIPLYKKINFWCFSAQISRQAKSTFTRFKKEIEEFYVYTSLKFNKHIT